MILKDNLIRFYEKYMILMGMAGHLIFVFQTHKMVISKSAHDVSLEGFLMAFLSIISWLLYGILKKDKVLMIVNIFGLVASTLCLITIFIFK